MKILNADLLNNSFNKTSKQRNIYKKTRSNSRLLLESILMFFVGMNLVIFSNSIPERFSWSDFLSDIWIDLSEGFVQLIQALIKIGTVTSIIFLLLFAIFLLLGGLIRAFKVLSRVRYNSKVR